MELQTLLLISALIAEIILWKIVFERKDVVGFACAIMAMGLIVFVFACSLHIP